MRGTCTPAISVVVAEMAVQIKRSNQLVPLDVNTAGTGLDFKQVVYQATGVPPGQSGASPWHELF